MTTPETVIAWLNKQLKQKEIALFRATHKPNRSDKEINDILGAIDAIECLKKITEGEQK